MLPACRWLTIGQWQIDFHVLNGMQEEESGDEGILKAGASREAKGAHTQ